jgi:hypothetical protein
MGAERTGVPRIVDVMHLGCEQAAAHQQPGLHSTAGDAPRSLAIADLLSATNTTRAVAPSPQTSGLLLDPEHPRKDTAEPVKAAVQRDIAECIQQLALVPQACEALKADSKLIDAVKALVDKGWTDKAKETAARTLATFYPEQIGKVVVDSLHIMMSCKHSVSSSALCLLRQVGYLVTHAMETHWCCWLAKINGMCKRCVHEPSRDALSTECYALPLLQMLKANPSVL